MSEGVRHVCIDDFAFRKGQRYGTVMVNIETGKVVDVLDSREYEKVKKWLDGFPELSIVCRDGSITFKKAITDSHQQAIQISDRFHILKNLTEYAKNYIKRTVPHRISLTPGDPVRTPLESAPIEGITKRSDDKREYNQAHRAMLIKQVRDMHDNGYTKRKIAETIGKSEKTIQRYLIADPCGIHGKTGVKKTSKLDQFSELIFELTAKGQSSEKILHQLRDKGYTGNASSTIRDYLRIQRPNATSAEATKNVIHRTILMKLLYKELTQIPELHPSQLLELGKLFPELIKLFQLLADFKTVLFAKKSEKLDIWIEEAKNQHITEISSFIKGLKRDIDAVKNAIVHPYSNGLAEGTVNKIKVIKRIMYGRCGFHLLRRKILLNNFN